MGAGMDVEEHNAMVLAKSLYYVELDDAGLDVHSVPLFDDLMPGYKCLWFDKAAKVLEAMEEFIG